MLLLLIASKVDLFIDSLSDPDVRLPSACMSQNFDLRGLWLRPTAKATVFASDGSHGTDTGEYEDHNINRKNTIGLRCD